MFTMKSGAYGAATAADPVSSDGLHGIYACILLQELYHATYQTMSSSSHPDAGSEFVTACTTEHGPIALDILTTGLGRRWTSQGRTKGPGSDLSVDR